MENKVTAVQKMQDYIEVNLSEKITLQDLADLAGYTFCYTSRIFKEITGISATDYIRARKLSVSAAQIAQVGQNILQVALDTNFESHEGYTRAFKKQFGLTPSEYQESTPPIPLFFRRNARDYYRFKMKGIEEMCNSNVKTVFVQAVERPARKLILKRGIKADNYFDYCEEVGCEVWGTLCSIKNALYPPRGFWLPEHLRKPETSEYVHGVEVSVDYAGVIPEGMEIIELPAVLTLEFHSYPFTEEEWEEAVTAVSKAAKEYQPEKFGYKWAPLDAPRTQNEPNPETGYFEAVPVKKL